MEQLKSMKELLTAQVQSQMGNLQNVDAKELGEAVDMIKDLSEAIYYCTITEAMNKKEETPKEEYHYYTTSYYDPYMYDRDMDRERYNRMYYSSSGNGSSGSNSSSMGGRSGGGMSNSSGGGGQRYYYDEHEYPIDFRDRREGRSPMKRKMYMESKSLHHDKAKQLSDLEDYMSELTHDLTEMIEDASLEEKQLLQKKISSLATKIEQINA